MTDFKKRVEGERDNLFTKVQALECFTQSSNFAQLDNAQRDLLLRQLQYMTSYLEVLDDRISYF